MATLNLNKHFNFSLYPNSVIGTVYSNTKLISILDYNTALKFSNIELLQKQIYPYLPEGTNSDHTNYTYYLFKHNDKDIVIANAWIISESVEETLGLSYNIRLNNITQAQLNIVRDQLRLLGISFDII
jgi:hypothetical protein